MNTQPWHFHVITGEPLDRIRKGNTERILAGEPDSREFRRGEPFLTKFGNWVIGCLDNEDGHGHCMTARLGNEYDWMAAWLGNRILWVTGRCDDEANGMESMTV